MLLNRSLKEFTSALRDDQAILLTGGGHWRLVHPSLKWTTWFRRDKQHALKLLHAFVYILDDLERTPVIFSSSHEQAIDFLGYYEAGVVLMDRLQRLELSASDLIVLKQRLIALQYRLEEANGGKSPQLIVSSGDFGKVLYYADQWKRLNPLFWQKALTHFEHERLAEMRNYPEFTQLMLESPSLRAAVFMWAMRDGIQLTPYIQYPGLCEKLVHINLASRIGRLGGDFLKIVKYPIGYQTHRLQKFVTLPFEGGDVNILDEDAEVVLHGNYHIKLKRIFAMFDIKYYKPGDVEFFALGIVNWNTHCLGWWNANNRSYELIDLSRDDWWLQMPLFEVLTLDEARKRYGMHLDGKQWVVVAQACREYMTMDFNKTHAYLELVIPLGNGAYSVYDFGKFATRFPFTRWEFYTMFALTHNATIAYPDENVYMTNRQHLGYAIDLTPEEGILLMESIKKDIHASREGNIVYQLAADNCGRWIQEKLEGLLGKEKIPNLFRITLIQAEPTGLLKFCYSWIKKLPRIWHSRVLAWVLFPFGAWKGKWVVDKHGQKEWISMYSSRYWEDGVVYLPAFLHRQRELGAFISTEQKADVHDADLGKYAHWDEKTSKWVYH